MIITRTPFRFTLGGGGTDLPSYYEKYGGFIFAVAINKYMFINLNRPILDSLIRVKYSKSETVNHRDELQHEIVKEAMRMTDIENSIEIASMADVPAGTGLGSSSCYAVGLLNALHTMKREAVDIQDLAEEACDLEINRLGKPIGKQDQYMAAFGGQKVLEIDNLGKVTVRDARIEESALDELNRNLLMFYTNTSRSSDKILSEQSKGAREKEKNVLDSLHRIKEIGYRVLEAAESGNITDIGLLFAEHWKCKKRMSSEISNSWLDDLYEFALENGALGGKITGAGGGGFFIFYVEKDHEKFREAMKKTNLKEMKYRFELYGTNVLINFMNRTR
jgi:D-glycero-alpha-D-manno-heptose-7-phosphate kinase